MGGEAAQLAQSHRGPQGRSSPTEDVRPSEEVWDSGNEALGTTGGLGLRQSLETRGGESSLSLDLDSRQDRAEASTGGGRGEAFS